MNAAARDSSSARPHTRDVLSGGSRTGTFESTLVRLVAYAGILGIGTALRAIVTAAGAAGWVTGLVVSVVTVALTAMLCSRRF